MNISRIIISRESLKNSDNAYHFDGYRKFKESNTIEQLDNLIAAVLYDIACKSKNTEKFNNSELKGA